MGEAGGLVRFFRVEAEHRLVDVTLKVRHGDEVIGSEDNPLKVPPKALNAVGRERTDGELLLAVADEHMVVVPIKSVVDGRLVGNNRAALGNEVLDDRDDGGCLGIGNLFCHLVGVRLSRTSPVSVSTS